MITIEMLEKRGYRRYKLPLGHELADAFYQRWICDDGGTRLYALDFFLYDHSRFDPNLKFGWSVTARMYRGDDESWDLKYIVDENHTLDDVEKFYADAYKRMGCCPDRHNN